MNLLKLNWNLSNTTPQDIWNKIENNIIVIVDEIAPFKDLTNSWPLCLTKLSLYLFVLFAIFGKAHAFCHSINRVFLISTVKFSNQKAGPPLTLPLELSYLPHTTSVVVNLSLSPFFSLSVSLLQIKSKIIRCSLWGRWI